MDFLLIESHFWVSDNSIRPNTRNVCSTELVSIIYKVAEIISPGEKIEVLMLPSEIWSYKDVFRIAWGSITTVATVVTCTYAILSYNMDSDKNELEMINSCIETIKNVNQLQWDEILVTNETFEKICEDYGVINSKNKRYDTLEKDETIKYEETFIKNWWETSVVISNNKIEREYFHNMITVLPEDENFEWNNYEWVIELISLVVKQKKEWRGIQWRWTYYWDKIEHNWIDILSPNDEINFYMQDETFKQKIRDQEVEFKSWDNITVIFDIKTEIWGWMAKNLTIYVKEVKSFNDAVIVHEVKTETKWENAGNQQRLFDMDAV